MKKVCFSQCGSYMVVAESISETQPLIIQIPPDILSRCTMPEPAPQIRGVVYAHCVEVWDQLNPHDVWPWCSV